MRLGNVSYMIQSMTRVFIANPNANECSALRLMLQNLRMEVIGDALDWPNVIASVPVTKPDILLVDWELFPADPAAHLLALRRTCSTPFFTVLTSYLDARQQAAISVGADAFISKFEAPNRLADRLLVIAKSLDALERYPVSNQNKGATMNKDVLEGQWKQIRGNARAWWGKLTDSDLERVAGKFEVLVGLLQERYGYTREQAANEVEERVSAYEAALEDKNRELASKPK